MTTSEKSENEKCKPTAAKPESELNSTDLEKVTGGAEATPILMKSCATGVHYPSVKLTV